MIAADLISTSVKQYKRQYKNRFQLNEWQSKWKEYTECLARHCFIYLFSFQTVSEIWGKLELQAIFEKTNQPCTLIHKYMIPNFLFCVPTLITKLFTQPVLVRKHWSNFLFFIDWHKISKVHIMIYSQICTVTYHKHSKQPGVLTLICKLHSMETSL